MAKDNKPRFSRAQNPPAQKAAAPTSESQKQNKQPQEQQQQRQQQQQQPEQPTEAEEPIPDLSKLPDLTQGIPSTLEYETAGSTSRSALSTVGDGGAPTSGGGRGKGELPASAYVSSSDRNRSWWARVMLVGFTAAAVGGTAYLGRDWEDDEVAKHPEQPNGWGLGLWWNRVKVRLGDNVTYYQDPAFEKLLPDLDPSFERPYTLCLSLEDLLVHSEWSREHGWRMAKRPGVDYFLRYLSQYYELVLFTSVPFAMAEPVLRKLDPYHFIMWPLGREATKYQDGEIVKDLSYLNRDLSKVIIIDTNAKHVRVQPENAIIVPKWTGDPNDKELVALVPFLEFIHAMQYGDVRKTIKSFDGTDIPVEFARREALVRAEHNKRLETLGRKKKGGESGMTWLGKALGLKPSNLSLMVPPPGEENQQEAFLKDGKMLQDVVRERGMRNYLLMEEEIRKNGEKWLKEDAEMQEKAQKEAMKNVQGFFTNWFKPADSEAQTPEQTPEKQTSEKSA